MGQCPCPRCLIPKDKISGLGLPADMENRTKMVRIDDVCRQNKIQAARSLIYNKGYVVNSTHIEDLLKDESLVPTEVSLEVLFHHRAILILVECILFLFTEIWT